MSTVLDTGSGPDLDIIQLDNIPDRHLTYRVKGICGGTICMDYGWIFTRMRAAAIIHYPLLMWTNDSTVQYSTVRYRVTHVQFLFYTWSLILMNFIFMQIKIYIYPRKIVLTFLLVIMLTIEAAESDWSHIPHYLLLVLVLVAILSDCFIWPSCDQLPRPPSPAPLPRVPISWQLDGTQPSKLQGLLSLNITPSCCCCLLLCTILNF